jgi:hypothetical protein
MPAKCFRQDVFRQLLGLRKRPDKTLIQAHQNRSDRPCGNRQHCADCAPSCRALWRHVGQCCRSSTANPAASSAKTDALRARHTTRASGAESARSNSFSEARQAGRAQASTHYGANARCAGDLPGKPHASEAGRIGLRAHFFHAGSDLLLALFESLRQRCDRRRPARWSCATHLNQRGSDVCRAPNQAQQFIARRLAQRLALGCLQQINQAASPPWALGWLLRRRWCRLRRRSGRLRSSHVRADAAKRTAHIALRWSNFWCGRLRLCRSRWRRLRDRLLSRLRRQELQHLGRGITFADRLLHARVAARQERRNLIVAIAFFARFFNTSAKVCHCNSLLTQNLTERPSCRCGRGWLRATLHRWRSRIWRWSVFPSLLWDYGCVLFQRRVVED